MSVGPDSLFRMSISEHAPGTAPAEVLADALALVRGLAETLWSARSDDELVDTVGQVQQVTAALAAVEAGAVAEADARDLAKQRLPTGRPGTGSPTWAGCDAVRASGGWPGPRRLTGPLARTREALVAGTVSPGQADVIVRSVEDLPPGDWTRRRGEKLMLRQAAHLDATELARAGRHLVEVVDPDGVDRSLEAALEREERAAHLDRPCRSAEDRAGGVRIRGRGTAEDGALLKAALLPLTRPEPADSTQPATWTRRPANPARRAPRPPRPRRPPAGTPWSPSPSTPWTPTCRPRPTPPPPDSWSPSTTTPCSDDLAARRAWAPPPTAPTCPPTSCAGWPATPRSSPPSSAPAARSSTSAAPDRLVTPALWTALVLRDRHCTFPACTRPPVMCHAHHLTHWADGGDHRLDNLALLCGHHHRVIHHTPWEIRLNPDDRRPEFLPPPKPGIDPEWIRYRPRLE